MILNEERLLEEFLVNPKYKKDRRGFNEEHDWAAKGGFFIGVVGVFAILYFGGALISVKSIIIALVALFITSVIYWLFANSLKIPE